MASWRCCRLMLQVDSQGSLEANFSVLQGNTIFFSLMSVTEQGLSNVIKDQSVQLFSHGQLFATPWTAALQASLSLTISWSLPTFISVELVMPSNHLILSCPLLLLPSVFPSIRVFFQWISCSQQVAKVLELRLQHQSFQWVFRIDFLLDWLVWSCCSRDSLKIQ